jgi:hypothetical protein
MSLKVGKVKIKAKHTVNQEQLWAMVNADPLLREYFNPRHPIFDYELIDCCDSLNFWVGFKNRPELGRVCGSAFVYDFRGVYTDEQTEAGFKISFHNVIRNLLVNVIHGDTAEARWEHKFFHDDGFSPNSITEYIKLCTQNLPFAKLQCAELTNAWRWWFTVDGCQDFGFHVPKDFAEKVLTSEFAGEANRTTRDHVTNLLVRAFLATKSNDIAKQEAQDVATLAPETAALMAEIRKSVATAGQVKKIDNIHDSQEKKLSALSLLPMGPTISHAQISSAMGKR